MSSYRLTRVLVDGCPLFTSSRHTADDEAYIADMVSIYQDINPDALVTTETAHYAACDMVEDCVEPVTYIDDKGFVYCTPHGLDRQTYRRCRKLRLHELRRISRGEQVAHY